MQASTTERAILISAPREQIWDAITRPDQLAQWFVPAYPDARMQQDETGKVQVYVGETGVDFAVLRIIDPHRQASITLLPDSLVTATFTLENENDGIHVSVALTGLELLSEETGDERREIAKNGWEQTLANLKAFVSGSEFPYPQAFIGPLFGFWKELKKSPTIERSIWIAASRERVWTAITDPKQLQQWFSPTASWELSSLEVGGRYYVRNEETNSERYVQIIELMDPPQRFVTRTAPTEETSGKERTIYTLMAENEGTRLTLTHTGYEPYEQGPDIARWGSMEQHGFGYGMALQNVKAFIAGEPLPWPIGF